MNDVSIIIPVYNDISIIKNLQTKILYLSSRYRQLIIIDDCSVDYTYLEIINFISHNKLKNIEKPRLFLNIRGFFFKGRH